MMDETGRSADDGDGSCGTPLTRNRLLLMSGLASGRAAGAGKGGRVTQRAWRISRGSKRWTLGHGTARDLPCPAGSTQCRVGGRLLLLSWFNWRNVDLAEGCR